MSKSLFMLYSEKQHKLIDFMKNNGFNITIFGFPQVYITELCKKDSDPSHNTAYSKLFYAEDYIKNNLEKAKKEYSEKERVVKNEIEKRKSRYKETKDDNIQPNSNNSDVIKKHKKSKPTQKKDKLYKLREDHYCSCQYCGLRKRRKHECNCKYCLLKNNHILDEIDDKIEDNSENEPDNDIENNPDDNSENNSENRTENKLNNETDIKSDNKIINNSVIKIDNKIINYSFICMFIISLILNIITGFNLIF